MEFVKSTLKKNGKYIYPATYYNQVIMPDGKRWDGTAGSDSVYIGNELPEDENRTEDILLWVDEDEPDITIGQTIEIGQMEPQGDSYGIWIDTSAEPTIVLPASETMRKDAMKYKAFSIATTDWQGTGPYTHTMSNLEGITESTAILNLTLDAASQASQKSQLDWETGEGYITLSTATKPTSTIAGYLIAVEVTVI